MVDVADSNHHQVLSIVVSSVEASHLVLSDVVHIVSVSLHWLAHHVLSKDVEVHILKGGFHVPLVVVFVFLADSFLNEFKF